MYGQHNIETTEIKIMLEWDDKETVFIRVSNERTEHEMAISLF